MAVKTRNPEFEKLILKALLNDREFTKKILGKSYSEDIFETPIHRFVFKEANKRYEKSNDLLSFDDLKYTVEKLVKDDEERGLKLSQINTLSNELKNLQLEKSRYAFCWEELLRLYQTRKFFEIVDQGLEKTKDPTVDPLAIISDIERMFHGVKKGSNQVKVEKENIFGKESIDKRVEKYHKEEGTGVNRGLPYFLPKLTEATGGIKPTDLIIFGARQKVGKSITLLNQAVFLSKLGYNVAYISIEQSKDEITLRADSLATELKHIDIKLRKLDEHNKLIYQAKLQELEKFGKFYCIDIPRHCTVGLIEREIKDLLEQGIGLNCIIVDYLGLINPSKESGNSNPHFSVGEITKQLKELCREIKIPIITAQQMNRESEKEKTKTANGIAMSDQIASHCDYFYALRPLGEGKLEVQTVLARDSDAITVQCVTAFDRMLIFELTTQTEAESSGDDFFDLKDALN